MENTEQQSQSPFAKGAIGILSLAVIISIGVYVSKRSGDNIESTLPTATTTTTATQANTSPVIITPVSTSTATNTPVTTNHYKNGAYVSLGSYTSPAGKETLTISVTLTNDVITQATFTGDATNKASIRWQTAFKDGFSDAVIGKNIDELSLTVVNGSSLTPKGFMDALAKIKTEAKS